MCVPLDQDILISPIPSSWQTLFYPLSLISLIFLDSIYKVIPYIICLSLSDISLSIIPSRSVLVFASGKILFFFMAK